MSRRIRVAGAAVVAAAAVFLALRGQDWLLFIGGSLVRAAELMLSGDTYIWSTMAVSMKVSLTSVAVATALSTPLALLLAFKNFPYKGVAVSVVNTGMGVPSVAVGLLVLLLVTRQGPLGPLDLVYTPAAMVLSQVVLILPLMTGVTYAALDAVPREVREAAGALGGTRRQVSLRVVREARLGIVTSVLAGFGRAISEVGGVLIVGGNIKMSDGTSFTRTLTTAISVETMKGEFEEAMAFGIVLVAIVLLVALATNYVERRAR